MCSPCGEDFGNNIPEGEPLAVLLATADKIGWLGRDSLAAFLQSAQGKYKAKASTPEHELAQKESEYNKASANERLLEKKPQKSTEIVEKLRKQHQRPRKSRNNLWMVCVLLQLPMATRMHRGMRQWNRTPTCSNKRIRY